MPSSENLFGLPDPAPAPKHSAAPPTSIFALWTNLERTLKMAKKRDSAFGILLVAHDDSPVRTAQAIATLLGGRHLEVPKVTPRREWWDEEIKPLADPNQAAMTAFADGRRDCVVIEDLDRRPEWLVRGVRYLLEDAKRPLCLIATARSEDDIPRDVLSFLSRCRKIGRPRQGEDA